MLSCSTCWNSDRHTNGGPMLQEILDLGFTNVELGHGIRLPLLEGIQKYFEQGKVGISSLHNFCPLPIEITHSSPDCYQFSSHRKLERERALRLTFQTIDFAARFGAPYVVMHLGRIPMKPVTTPLINMAEKGEIHSRKFVQKKIDAVRVRESKSAYYLKRVREYLDRIAEYATTKNIHLGIEGRHSYEEIPSEREILGLLDEINSPYVGYWHDIGHIQIKNNLGFLDHYEWLKTISPRLLGCHLHDTEWPGNDHRVPFSGNIDYDKLIPLLPKNCLFVFEMSPRRKKEEIKESLQKWKSRFGE